MPRGRQAGCCCSCCISPTICARRRGGGGRAGRARHRRLGRPSLLTLDHAQYGLLGKSGRAGSPGGGKGGMWGIVIFDMTCARLRLKKKKRLMSYV